MVEMIQEIIRLASARAVAEMVQAGRLLTATGPEDAVLADGIILDGDFHRVCLFDDAQTGWDNEEAGFA